MQDVIFKPLKAEDVKKVLNSENDFVKNINYNKNLLNINVESTNSNNIKNDVNALGKRSSIVHDSNQDQIADDKINESKHSLNSGGKSQILENDISSTLFKPVGNKLRKHD